MSSKKLLFCKKKAANLLLDLYPADFAYWLAKISSSYSGACIRVYEDTNNTTLDIGFLGVDLDISTLMSFVGSGNGYINRIYSQTTGGNYLQENVIADMPRIVTAGVLETLNGKPSMYFDGVSDFLSFLTNETVTNDFSMFSYGKRDASGNIFAPFSNPAPGPTLIHYSDNNIYLIGSNGYDVSTSTDTSSSPMLLEGHSTISNRDIYKNQILVTTSSVGASFSADINRVGTYGGQFMKGHLNGGVLYKSNQNANRIAIGNEILNII